MTAATVNNHHPPELKRETSTVNLPTSLSFANLQQNAQRVGFLLKHEKGFLKDLFGRSWKRKYCILSGYHFYFFKNKKGSGREKSNGVINLRYFDRCTLPTDKHANLPHAFCLASSQKSDNHSFLFQADSVDEQQRWITDIQLVIFQCQTQGRAGQNISIRPHSQPDSPVLQQTITERDDRSRRTSIPEPGYAGVYRTTSTGEESVRDEPPPETPTEVSVSRSESRAAKPDLLVPKMPKYNQVVSELQSRLHTRPDNDDEPYSPHRLAPRTSSGYSSQDPNQGKPESPQSDESISSYDNNVIMHDHHSHTADHRRMVPESPDIVRIQTSTTNSTVIKINNNSHIDSQFDDVLRMMEKLADEEGEVNTPGAEYAIPYVKTKERPPAVPPKPKREAYESLLSSHVTYQDMDKMYLLACKALVRAEAARELHEEMMRELKERFFFA